MTTDHHAPTPRTAPPAGPSRTYLWGGVALALLGVVLLAATLASNTLVATTTTTAAFDGVDRVVLDLRASGDVEVVGADTDRVEVERTVRSLLGGTVVEQDQTGTTLRLASRCRMRVLAIGCGASYRVTVPHDTALAGSASNGRVGLDAVAGTIDVATSNGDIVLAGGTEPVVLRTSNGRIEVRDTRSPVLELTTSNGDVLARVEAAPDRLVARTSNGRIEVLVPDDGTAYAVDATTSNGRTDVGVATDASARSVIEARTSNGDVTVRPIG